LYHWTIVIFGILDNKTGCILSLREHTALLLSAARFTGGHDFSLIIIFLSLFNTYEFYHLYPEISITEVKNH
jgi:hypothetical protein